MRFFKKLFTKTFVVLFILLCAFGIFFYWGWFEKQYDKCVGMYYVYKGDKAFKHRDLQKAIDFYNRGLALYPEHYSAWFNLGNIYVTYEDYYAAADSYEKAIQYKDDYTLARMNLGIISAEKLGNFDGAISQYDSIINSHKHLWFIPFVFRNTKSEKFNRGLAYYNKGVAYREKSLYQNDEENESSIYLRKAIESYQDAVKILKKDYDARYNLALAYHLSGDYQNAGLNYCKAIDIQPMNYEAHYNLAILLKHLRKYKESLNELQKAGIIVSNDNSNTNNASYVFNVLNDVSMTMVAHDQYKYLVEKIDDEPSSNAITYVNGKMVASDALDRAILKNLQTCESEKYFKNY